MTLNTEEIRRVYDHDRHGREVGRLVLDTVEALCDEVDRLRAATTVHKIHLHRDDCPATLRLIAEVVGPHGRPGYEPTDVGAYVDWIELASRMSSTEDAVLRIAQGLAILERRGGNGRLKQAVVDAVEAAM